LALRNDEKQASNNITMRRHKQEYHDFIIFIAVKTSNVIAGLF